LEPLPLSFWFLVAQDLTGGLSGDFSGDFFTVGLGLECGDGEWELDGEGERETELEDLEEELAFLLLAAGEGDLVGDRLLLRLRGDSDRRLGGDLRRYGGDLERPRRGGPRLGGGPRRQGGIPRPLPRRGGDQRRGEERLSCPCIGACCFAGSVNWTFTLFPSI